VIGAKVNEIVDKVFDGSFIAREEIGSLLRIDPHSMEGGLIMTAVNSITRSASQGRP
jgi:hypothetical protein